MKVSNVKSILKDASSFFQSMYIKEQEHSKISIGLDIGTRSIKAVALEKKADIIRVVGYKIKDICFQEANKNSSDLEKIITEVLSGLGARANNVNIAMSGAGVIVRFVKMPKMTKNELKNAILMDAERYIPFNASDVVIDFFPLDSPEDGEMNVILSAVKKDLVDARLELFKKLGINIDVIDLDIFSVLNAFLIAYPVDNDKVYAFIDWGYSKVNFLISEGGLPRFMRFIQLGAKDMNKAVSCDMDLPLVEAEKACMECSSDKSDNVFGSMETALKKLVKEIEISVGYFESNYHKNISGIYLSGGVVVNQKIIEYMKEEIGMDIKIWNPFEKFICDENLLKEINSHLVFPKLAVSAGAALR
ncbi:type IV pilus assembly protein PilM [Candidatus Omnitrophus magneticus]|uniref:Type IV pilus assembly protein PilM n=1 Tax=Candidatus Omnitrophus magneticus TaxID=1609969 RepID=A0A0F0CR88_9BACT|nr:type IV pilus assembly protein PilM [Candidatus Omnitrophus magneticus]